MGDEILAVFAAFCKEFLKPHRGVATIGAKIEDLMRTISNMGAPTASSALVRSSGRLAEYGGRVGHQLAKIQALTVDAARAVQSTAEAFKLTSSIMMRPTPAGAAWTISELRSALEGSLVVPVGLQFAAERREAISQLTDAPADRQVIAQPKGLDARGTFVDHNAARIRVPNVAQAYAQIESAALLMQGLLAGKGFSELLRMAGSATSPTQLYDYLRQTVKLTSELERVGGLKIRTAMTNLLSANRTKERSEEESSVGWTPVTAIRKAFDHNALAPDTLVGNDDLASNVHRVQHDLELLLREAELGMGMAGVATPVRKGGVLDRAAPSFGAPLAKMGAMLRVAKQPFAFVMTSDAPIDKFGYQFGRAVKDSRNQLVKAWSRRGSVENREPRLADFLEALGSPTARIAIPIGHDHANGIEALTVGLGAHPDAAKNVMANTPALRSLRTIAGASLAARGTLRAAVGAEPDLDEWLGRFAVCDRSAEAARLLSTGQPKLGLAVFTLSEVLPMYRHSFEGLIAKSVGGRATESEVELGKRNRVALEKDVLEKGRFAGHLLELRSWHLPMNWELRGSGRSPLNEFAAIPSGTSTTRSPLARGLMLPSDGIPRGASQVRNDGQDITINTHVEVHLPPPPMTPADVKWLAGAVAKENAARVRDEVRSALRYEQQRSKRRTFLDPGFSLSGYSS